MDRLTPLSLRTWLHPTELVNSAAVRWGPLPDQLTEHLRMVVPHVLAAGRRMVDGLHMVVFPVTGDRLLVPIKGLGAIAKHLHVWVGY